MLRQYDIKECKINVTMIAKSYRNYIIQHELTKSGRKIVCTACSEMI